MNDIEKRFASDTAKHELTIALDEGLYRHLKFRQPEHSWSYWFDLVTWPGTLVIRGDMHSFVFAREQDMFPFMRRVGRRIDYSYWAEKEQTGAPTREHSPEAFSRAVWSRVRDEAEQYPGLAKAVQAHFFADDAEWNIEYAEEARAALEDFEYSGGTGREPFRFDDPWEMDTEDWTPHFVWCCLAIQWGIGQYDAAKQPVTAAAGGAA